ncbi:helicase [Nocardiopsis sp. TSRI0078]|uniref:helicase-related protein n=1 Tax=unclassified Nocardiopsis TaxID=2649073 RepID=UPI00093EFED1|nr:helicase-related protein [Nocardiopsis sp. TSRI0078]OKI17017.1 helicase [Nocardiopsis sp. TSRI0078]
MPDHPARHPEAEVRGLLAAALRRQLVGPADGTHEVLTVPPDRRYLMGTLYPQEADLHSRLLAAGEEAEGRDAESPTEENAFAEDPTSDANAWLPSSLGLSVFTDAPELRLTCEGSRYVTSRTDGRRCWTRVPFEEETVRASESDDLPVFGGRALLRVRRRPYAGAWLVTVALVNAAVAEPPDAEGTVGHRPARTDWDRMLFQAAFTAEPLGGAFLEYPGVLLTSRDPEEEELRLQYRHVRTFAVGHGCAVAEEAPTSAPEGAPPTRVRTEVMPTEEVLQVRHAGQGDARALRLSYLGDGLLPASELAETLSKFTRGYREWYEDRLSEAAAEVPPWGRVAAERILSRVHTALSRMEAGARLLCEDPVALAAFRMANQAMALQMRRGARDLGGRPRNRTDPLPRDTAPDGKASWRPFQLGFFLLCAGGLIDPAHPDREITDVIWFPTGGGKTEAYLLLSCFEMLLRRLRHGAAGGGTAVLSRYTLSLLTTQQFQRAGTTICALEYLRSHPEERACAGLDLGAEPFSIGLWVGEATTPNTYDRAHDIAEGQRSAAQPTDAFVLDRCPWCGTRIMPRAKSSDPGDYGVRTTPTSFSFFCPREECAFHETLPVRVVDTHLYDEPPSFLLGTVDKFARLAWEHRAGRLFGGDTLRPSLVIQDELHLLTGPLGTTVGLYESAVLQLCSWDGVPPKLVASTATIRRSGEQVRLMYGRDVQLFPPPGLDARHSYFAEPDEDKPGRLYVGVMAQGHTAGRATVATAASTLHEAALLPEEHRDDYWTLVAYHHSLRELGRTLTAARDDIPAQLAGMGGADGRTRDLAEQSVQELTSNLDREEQPRLLARLEEGWPASSAVSFLACTNMLSVGVDVGRLALMLMLGQPKASAEYIQATSRVGRDRVPGLIVAFFNATKPRDRSHYETFGVFHRSLYRHVEPSSVTPWSIPSRRRALHAALVILLRHGHGWSGEDRAMLVLDHPDTVADAVERLVSWVARTDPAAETEVSTELKDLIADWHDAAVAARQAGANLYWSGQGRATRHLLKNFDRRNGLWETLNSVRSVDRECQITVKGAGA